MTPDFKIGDTIKVVTRLIDDAGNAVDVSSKILRSVLKSGSTEIVGVTQLLDQFTVEAIFDTTGAPAGRYQTDVRYDDGVESFSTPTVIINLGAKVS